MKKGGFGGFKTKSGLNFETESGLLELRGKPGDYTIDGNEILYQGQRMALRLKKGQLYKFLSENGIDYKKIISRKLLPDDSLYIINKNKFIVFELKFQGVEGSTDEKLQTCDFKIKQYRKLLKHLHPKIEINYIYVLSDWFKKEKYSDVLDYILSIEGCFYYFNEVPLKDIGLPG